MKPSKAQISPSKSELVAQVRTPNLAVIEPLVAAAEKFASEARAPATRRAYAYQFERFETWCQGAGLASLPAAFGTVALYLTSCAEQLRPASISQAMAAISAAHRDRGLVSPCAHPKVAEVWHGIARKLGMAQTQKAPLATEQLRSMADTESSEVAGLRNMALLAIGFAGGFRRSELCAVLVADVAFVREGVEITVRKSKTDQTGKGMLKVISYGGDPATCPVRSLRAWLDAAEITDGPVFRRVDRNGYVGEKALSGQSVALIVKAAALRADIDPAQLSGHSLRAGFVTEAKKHGADDAAIMAQTGHKSLEMLQRYHRRIKAWDKPASAKLGL